MEAQVNQDIDSLYDSPLSKLKLCLYASLCGPAATTTTRVTSLFLTLIETFVDQEAQ